MVCFLIDTFAIKRSVPRAGFVTFATGGLGAGFVAIGGVSGGAT